MSGYKSVEVLQGDTMQRLALREMGDASLWVEIATLNNLKPPYLDAVAGDGVIAYGDVIYIPIEVENPVAEKRDQFLTDLKLDKKSLTTLNGDICLISGVPNLVQALKNRIDVSKRSLWFHPEYGCWVHSMRGAVNGLTAGSLAAFYVKSSVLEDERIASVEEIIAEVIGDTIHVYCKAMPVYGESISFNTVI